MKTGWMDRGGKSGGKLRGERGSISANQNKTLLLSFFLYSAKGGHESWKFQNNFLVVDIFWFSRFHLKFFFLNPFYPLKGLGHFYLLH